MSTLCARNGRASTRLTVAVRQALFGSTLALLATSTALSQEQETLEAVVVTGTRIKRDGYSAPTPTTIVTQEDIAAAAPGTVADGLNQLPQFQGSSTPQAGGVSANGAAGSNFLSLRNLEPHRSLILLDGRRFVAATDSGATDINTLPQNLIERVDVVTGGASAAYGSDAVAGVVNFVLDTDFVGWKGNVQGGMSTYGDSESVKASIAHGRPLAGGRGHLLFSAEYYKSEGIGPYDDNRKWNTRGSGRINNTTGVGPRTLVVKDGATVSAATFGGLITAGPLAGTQFLPGGIPAPFEFGEYRSSTFMIGGDGIRNDRNLTAGLERWNVFVRADYDVTDDINLFFEGTYADAHTTWEQYYNYCYTSCAATIFIDNAFLPAATRQAMIDAGIDSFRLNRIHAENYILADNQKDVWRGVIGANGRLGGDWSWDAYVTQGESETYVGNPQTLHYRRYYAAIDAVVDPDTGQIVCRSTLFGYDPGCVPFNPFGQGSPSPESMAYVTPTEWRNLVLKQTVVAATVQGSLFEISGRPVALATGFEYRKESSDQTVSPIALEVNDFTGIRGANTSIQGQEGPFIVGNPQPLAGSYNVKEAFVEIALPLLADVPGARALDLDLAGRYTDYSLSGGVKTWKGSLSYQPVDSVRLRATRSRDIRAPNVAELFTGARQGIGTARDPASGQTVDVVTKTRGNPLLDPEIADTLTAGVVFQPQFVDGLSLSADFYSIEIEGAISTLGRQETLDQCYAGNQMACDNIEIVGTSYRIDLPFLNLDLLKVKGWDFEASYSRPVGPGDLSVRLFANYQYKYERTTPGGIIEERAGEVGLSDNPKWRGKLAINYAVGPLSVLLQERYIHSGIYDRNEIEGVTINDNHVEAVWYTDLTATYKFGDSNDYQVFLTVNNLFNREPPFAPTVSGTHLAWSNFSLYDTIGRYFTLGARLRF
jgi:iron complex outermembrane receptor protein